MLTANEKGLALLGLLRSVEPKTAAKLVFVVDVYCFDD
jgi:hypothetical protein